MNGSKRRGVEDVTKLPQWAQQRIQTLEANITYYREREREVGTPGESDTEIVRYADGENVSLPSGERIRFKLSKNDHVDVYIKDGRLTVHGLQQLAIVFNSGNLFYVEPRP